MRWADALTASGEVKCAVRPLKDYGNRAEPNVLLIDKKFNTTTPKAFWAVETYGWKRVQLRVADKYDDWAPATIKQAATPWETS